MKTLVVCSGGLDSVTLAYKVAQDPTEYKDNEFWEKITEKAHVA